MTYSTTADSPLFHKAQLHDNEQSEANQLKEIKASHHLVRNNPLARVGATAFRASCIGDGANPVFDPDTYPAEFITAFQHWTHYCDFNEQTNFAGVQALAVVTAMLEGTAFIIRRRTLNHIPLQLQVVSVLSLARNLEAEGESNYIRGGILYSKNGKVKKYAFYKYPQDHPSFSEDDVNWIPAADVCRLEDTLHPGQSGDHPWITAGAEFAQQYKDNQTVETKSRLKRQGQQIFVIRENTVSQTAQNGPPQMGQRKEPEKAVVRAGDVTLLNGAKDVKTASPPEMTGNYQEHNRQVLRMIAGLLNITYEQFTGDLTQVNYSSIRAGMINHRRKVGQQRKINIEPLLNKMTGWFCDAYALTPNPELPGYFDNPYVYICPMWIWPEWEEVDPLKAAKALVLEVQEDIKSLEEISNERGKTLDQHLDSVRRSKEAKEARGLLSPSENGTEPDDDDTEEEED